MADVVQTKGQLNRIVIFRLHEQNSIKKDGATRRPSFFQEVGMQSLNKNDSQSLLQVVQTLTEVK
jgi:hypothetical protein